jgi:hypothetical protein
MSAQRLAADLASTMLFWNLLVAMMWLETLHDVACQNGSPILAKFALVTVQWQALPVLNTEHMQGGCPPLGGCCLPYPRLCCIVTPMTASARRADLEAYWYVASALR